MRNQSRLPKGLLIAFEGIDAAGKGTQSKRLAEAFRVRRPAGRFSFPNYDTESGKAILAMLKGEWYCHDMLSIDHYSMWDSLVRQALFLLNKAEAAPTIEALIADGKHVICDRYWPSAVTYGKADGLDLGMLIEIHKFLPRADVMLLLDVPIEESVRRKPVREDKYEKNLEKLKQVRQNYLSLFEYEEAHDTRTKWKVLDGMGSVEEVEKRIQEEVAFVL